MMIFISSISKQYGDHILKRSMREMNEFMRITGKILEENHNYFHIHMNNVLSGIQEPSYRYMEMDVKMSSYVHSVMDGKSKSITLKTTR